MKKRKLIGLSMALLGIVYMTLFFIFTDEFEKINDLLCMILTILNAVFIIFGLTLLFLKTQEDIVKEEVIKREENTNLSKYYKYKPYVTYLLLVINVLAFIFINIFNDDELIIKFAISKNDFAFYKIFTAMFTHINESHLFCNMIVLYWCGSKLESLIGNVKYLLIYLLSGVFTSIFIVLFSSSPCVGASGAIFGLFGCYLLLAYRNKTIMKYTFKYDLLPTVIINLIVTFVMPNVSIVAHVGGLLVGMLLYFIFCRKLTLM